jgi:hypothetical protein
MENPLLLSPKNSPREATGNSRQVALKKKARKKK